MLSLEDRLVAEFREYALLGEPAPLDLQTKLVEAGFIIDELWERLITKHMYEDI